MARKRKIPQRKCIITNEMKPKEEMIRIVRTKEGDVFIDPKGKQNGRGAYLTIDPEVFRKARETNILNEVFKIEVDPSIYDELEQLLEQEHE